MMMLTVHNLAKEYGMLPSQALARASTLDLYILDLSARWQRHQQEVAEGKAQPKKNHGLSLEQMQAMISAVKQKEQNNGR